ncbi:MAG TPA: leucine--tRNA ligase [Spirochaetota bacterium]|nr:leucine--tRNA ligase [Spirochaetota bacterium]HOM37620.1 leucine--tRNA ligase [Spirochaetota bacterium]HPQ49409.1 leucine--tRNA ligase [Spirochaetota bacterium]
MEKEYKFWEIENKIQHIWYEKGYFKTKDDGEKKFYTLVMFPYPSGRIHMGHIRNYTIGDIIARVKKLEGYDVLHPIGWDSFGLPAENAAIDNNIHPAKWTFENIDYMKNQLKKMGFSYDWDREVTTCKPEYYKWNQWFFIKMYEMGLVEKKNGSVNWCPKCQTVLANEQVEENRCWRCDSEIEIKELSQWYLKITKYADRLLSGHSIIEKGWPERVIVMQKNWIGKSYGLHINFKLDDGRDFPIFTTRPDTIFGVTYMAIAPEHPLVDEIIEKSDKELSEKIKEFIRVVKKETKIERTSEGVDKKGIFTGRYVIHPFTGDKIPLYIADFVLMEYGTGAIMAVPAHDKRDFRFAKKYNIPIKQVIKPEKEDIDITTDAYTDDGFLVDSGKFTGMYNKDAIEAIIKEAENLKIGKGVYNYRLKDWLISRQRYWGTPIPVVYCDKCGTVVLNENDLPVILPTDVKFSVGANPLTTSSSFVNTKCPKCGGIAKRETDTMDTFIDSSWYYARYVSPNCDTSPFDTKNAEKWLPVNQYIGGIEHAVLHLLYARFFHKVMKDLGLVNCEEPFLNLLTQGMVVANSYYCKECRKYIPPKEVVDNKCPLCNKELVVTLDKMSKSKKNGVDPDDIVQKYGADTVRLFMLFAAPPEKDLEWSDKGIEGSFRFLKRVYSFVDKNFDKIKDVSVDNIDINKISKEGYDLLKLTHKTIKKVTHDFINRYHFNTGIAAMMEFLNSISDFEPKNEADIAVLRHAIENLLILLFPVAPHICDYIYLELTGKSIYEKKWPSYDDNLTKDETVNYAVQVNGKLRATFETSIDENEEQIIAKAKEIENVKKHIENKTIVKTIFVKNKLINIVIK